MKTLGMYLLMWGLALSAVFLLAQKGAGLVPNHGTAVAPAPASPGGGAAAAQAEPAPGGVRQHFARSLGHPVSVLLLQVVVILLVSRVLGLAFQRLGQPMVVGEITAGIMLGPSLLGWVWPGASAFVFPAGSLGALQVLSQVGLILFMFIVGLELDVSRLRSRGHQAVVVSHASIVFPYLLGMVLAYGLYQRWAPAGVSFLPFALFMGIALSITAFPVLARILQERGLTRTPLGAMALTCAAADDVTAWCLLAVVIAIARAGDPTAAVLTVSLAVAFLAFMLGIVRPLLGRLVARPSVAALRDRTVVAAAFALVLATAYAAEVVGIHALSGAFVAGVITPRGGRLVEIIRQKTEDLSVVLLLPIFFALTGLRTQIGLLNDGGLWALCALVVFLAVAGKLGGSAAAARLVGCSWKDSLSIGVLMNTRGLMELVALNIGYELGILSPGLFAILVLMAVATTFMAGPLLDLLNYAWREQTALEAAPGRGAPRGRAVNALAE